MICPECNLEKGKNIGDHLFFTHGYSKDAIAEWRNSEKAKKGSTQVFCELCDRGFWSDAGRIRHLKSVHVVVDQPRRVRCPLCPCTFVSVQHLAGHAQDAHPDHGDFTIRKERFHNPNDYELWREKLELSTNSFFVTDSVTTTDIGRTRYLKCSQERMSRRRQLGSSRTRAFYCTAHMKVVTKDLGVVEVTYCATHLGHRSDESPMALTEDEKRQIRSALAGGHSVREVVNLFRPHDPSHYTRLAVITEMDVREVKERWILAKQRRKAGRELANADREEEGIHIEEENNEQERPPQDMLFEEETVVKEMEEIPLSELYSGDMIPTGSYEYV